MQPRLAASPLAAAIDPLQSWWMAPIRRLISRLTPRTPRFTAPIKPEESFAAIGDIHGRDDLLGSILDKLQAERPGLPLVFLGDYIDRGPESARVLRRLRALGQAGGPKVICLMGNHEAMMLDFLALPARNWPLWSRNGGGATLRSFGVDPDNDISAEQKRDALQRAAGHELLEWIAQRPLVWQSGNVLASHAGGDPTRPIEPRRGHGLLWGHPNLLSTPRRDDLWMVHGHFIRPVPEFADGRISIDTGAFQTNRLTAAIVEPGHVRFLST